MFFVLLKNNYELSNAKIKKKAVDSRAVDPHCFDADPYPAQNLDADPDPDPDPGGGGRSAKNVHPPWQNPGYAPAYCKTNRRKEDMKTETFSGAHL
jgi:hypothetical protein